MSVPTNLRATLDVANKAAQSGITATGNIFETAATSVNMLHAFVEKEALLQRRGYAQEVSIRTQELAMELTNRTININKQVAAMDENAKGVYDNLLKQLEAVE